MLCMVGSGNGASNWVEMLIGHVWGGPVVGTTSVHRQKFAKMGQSADQGAVYS